METIVSTGPVIENQIPIKDLFQRLDDNREAFIEILETNGLTNNEAVATLSDLKEFRREVVGIGGLAQLTFGGKKCSESS